MNPSNAASPRTFSQISCQSRPLRLSHFECGEILADGTSATVVAARPIPRTPAHERISGRQVVLKTVPRYNMSRSGRRKLIREAGIHKLLRHHPHIPTFHGSFENQQGMFLVMERLYGPTIHDLLLRYRRLNERLVLGIVGQLVETIAYMHSRGFSHRDISSKNVMFQEEPALESGRFHIMLVDMGQACHLDTQLEDENRLYSEKVGTLRFTAPEVHGDICYRAEACDMWSIGVLMYLMLMGKYPFSGKNEEEVLQRITQMTLNFRGGEWDLISDKTKVIVKSLPEGMPSLRPDSDRLKSDVQQAMQSL